VLELSHNRIQYDESGRFPIERSSSAIVGCQMASHSMSQPVISTGPNNGLQSQREYDGSIERADIDGKNRKVIVPNGCHVHAEADPARSEKRQALLVRDREGMRVMRCTIFDGSQLENARRDWPWRRGSARSDQVVRRDHDRPQGQAGLLDPKGSGQRQSGPESSAPGSRFPVLRPPANRSDIEVFFDHLPEPIDLELRSEEPGSLLDRPRRSPRGNTVEPRIY